MYSYFHVLLLAVSIHASNLPPDSGDRKNFRLNESWIESGSAFFPETLKYGVISLKTGRVFSKMRMRVNMVTQEVHFLTPQSLEIVIGPGNVKNIVFTDTTESGITPYKMQTGYPAIDRQTDKNFYIVLVEGKCSLLKAILKKVTEVKDDMNGRMDQNYDTSEELYIFSGGSIKKWKRDKDFILPLLADKKNEVAQFAEKQKTNFRKQDDVMKLLEYYNTLL